MPKLQQPESPQRQSEEPDQQQEQQHKEGQAGPLTEYNPEDWFVPLQPPFKRKSLCNDGKKRQWKRLRQLLAAENFEQLPASVPTFVNAEAPPSVYPAKKYCDITGFEAPYVDPKTKLRYASAEVFPVVRSLPPDAVQARLAIRGAEVILK